MASGENAGPMVYTVSGLVALIKSRLEKSFPLLDVEGEISGWTLHTSGHAYFSIKDEGALLSAILYRTYLGAICQADPILAARLRRQESLNGAKVKLRGTVSMYPPRGNCQFIVRRLRLAGNGDLMAQYLALKEKLEKEGLFSATRKRAFPFLPQRIALVTSFTGAVVHDMARVILRRCPSVALRLYPVSVQGAAAPGEVVGALKYFNSLPATERPQVIIVARGGGSFEDLFCFNDEALVRAVAQSEVPVLSAIGHESDVTLCDFAADVRAGTPSMAAELVVPERTELLNRLSRLETQLKVSLRDKYEFYAQRVDHLTDTLEGTLKQGLQNASTRLNQAARTLGPTLTWRLAEVDGRLRALEERAMGAIKLGFTQKEARLSTLTRAWSLLSPYAVLDRGYSLTTTSTGHVVTDATQVQSGETLVTRLAKGLIESTVTQSTPVDTP